MEAKILLTFLISYLIGTAMAPLILVDISHLLLITAGLFVASVFMHKNKIVLVVGISLAVLFISIVNYEYKTSKIIESANHLEGRKSTFVVLIDDMPSGTSFGQRVKAKVISVDGQQENAKVNLFAPKFPELEYGQLVEFEGKVSGFSETPGRYLKDGQIGSVSAYQVSVVNSDVARNIKYYLLKIRKKFNESVTKLLPSSEANLAQGLIMGERAVFDDQFKIYLQNSGTTHIIALSGYNITIILGIFIIFRKYFSKLVNFMIPVIFVVIFIIMTGASASIVRAGIMGLMPLLARYLGRSSQSLIAIVLSATLMVAINPLILLYDIGFQLSFAAIVGVVYLAPKIKFGNALPGSLRSIFTETIAAQIATLPIIVYYFGSVSLVSPLANLAILWLVPTAMFLSFLTGIMGLVSGFFGSIVALPTAAILASINYLIEVFGSLPYAARALEIKSPIWILIYYLIILDIFFIFKKGERVRPT
jgi:competence protein ComEC